MQRLALSLVVPALLGLGCTAPSASDSESSAIIGGTTDKKDPAIIALFAQVPGSSEGSLCTAELIAPTVLLTAAHCVLPSEVGKGAEFIAITSYDFNTATSSETVAVKETHYDSSFDINSPENGYDVGIAILEKPLSITPLAYNQKALAQSVVGENVRLVGYGNSNGAKGTGSGIKRTTTAAIDSLSTRLIEIGSTKHETCNGDSGGPALMTIDGVETIIGTTSYGDSECTGGGYDTRVDKYAAFIGQYAK